ncbi:hypothetical protein SAMN02745126_06557 [Enhydrobacter aerosaccus]|uniref:Uncharacterized protein n=1 Tax=Enhydrobacter aerosaccus TaxID=225324 RepID=A0A1T4TNG2_9HYPH|nr:hypothetical protein SAMN02745126_06557 [Enhydrobacter aerosaccus]
MAASLPVCLGIRRFTRLTNAFSKKIDNHFFALAIYFMHDNYVRIHQTLRVTPASDATLVVDVPRFLGRRRFRLFLGQQSFQYPALVWICGRRQKLTKCRYVCSADEALH